MKRSFWLAKFTSSTTAALLDRKAALSIASGRVEACRSDCVWHYCSFTAIGTAVPDISRFRSRLYYNVRRVYNRYSGSLTRRKKDAELCLVCVRSGDERKKLRVSTRRTGRHAKTELFFFCLFRWRWRNLIPPGTIVGRPGGPHHELTSSGRDDNFPLCVVAPYIAVGSEHSNTQFTFHLALPGVHKYTGA